MADSYGKAKLKAAQDHLHHWGFPSSRDVQEEGFYGGADWAVAWAVERLREEAESLPPSKSPHELLIKGAYLRAAALLEREAAKPPPGQSGSLEGGPGRLSPGVEQAEGGNPRED